ncbi:MAG: HupE/UreJ family protein [Alphaproteobacteria bacterium]
MSQAATGRLYRVPLHRLRVLGLRVRGLWVLASLCAFAGAALAHDVSAANARYVAALDGPAPVPFLYLGAKHMVTGLDHVFFLIGVVFFIRRLKDILLYVSLFTVGHSLTLLGGVFYGVSLNHAAVDAVIGVSVLYKAFENMGGFDRLFGRRFDMRAMVFGFGLVHGLGLSGKLQDLSLSDNGLLVNLVSFNLGVEIGQVIVLTAVIGLLDAWRRLPGFSAQAFAANTALMAGGVVLTGLHLFGLLVTP